MILILATIAFGTIGVLFSSVWELDEQAMSLIVVAISLATLLTTAATSRLPMRSPA